ncbi:putative acyl-CoA dehydrogenase [Streptomyces ambofaciens ATCC 23877]|uniref:Putative acyl-CoA dehydrogenase n=1 Tax=Streptomyces ambofaciens (strain ATCC 23877 / 3486 / DSM 40053 / JCM 4204 / NBRC 12836 / NRRL B-2516) TaxID=278992 RepID=A0AC97_STRA7|nr:acyl-CoA dehydrogenase family protein [Streptomyces ambofaciens]AKZ60250.1 putative acyl-CoA dehydrogenase [Streptomyces ambofaciens ATCC 23877]CAJ88101.1 putative acyl-CoA dehydrogenase [Streptomyces ambofaciens ATCC 23877]
MGLASAPPLSTPPSDRSGPGRAHWLRVAREVADDLATDAVAREQAGKAPFDEVSRLREAGLLTFLMPTGSQEAGPDRLTAYAVVREIAAADGAIGQLLGSHYFLSWSVRFFAGPALAARIEERSAAEEWCWGGGFARQEPPLVLARTSKGLVLNGRQSYTSGVQVADRLAVRGVREDTGEPLAVVVDPGRRGVVIDGDADPFGQRLAAGGSVEFDDVPVGAEDVLGTLSADEDLLSPRAALASPVGRLFSAQLLLGMAEGVLAEAREYSRTGHAAGHPSWPVGTPHDPQVQTAYGELTVLTRSASALTAQALEAVRDGLERDENLTYDECADISALVAMAESAAARAAQESTIRALDVIGARSTSTRLGFDRFWRNTRAHTLYEPVSHRLRDVGHYFLSGAHPPFVLPA